MRTTPGVRAVPRVRAGVPEPQGAGAPVASQRALPSLPPPPVWAGPPGADGRVLLDAMGMLPGELADLFVAGGEPPYRGRQLFSALHAHGATDYVAITVLPEGVRARLAAEAAPPAPALVARRVDPLDGTVKYLFRLGDGETVETVLMRYRFGYTACVSSQVGCRQGCRFCASTIGGLTRNLLAGEMAAQIAYLNRDLSDPTHAGDTAWFPVPGGDAGEATDEGEPEAQGRRARFDRVSRVVVMGIGEPMENLDAVIRFLRVVHEPSGAGIGWRHMTVSTSGLVAAMDRMALVGLPITLAVSLHAPNDELRNRLVPVNRRYPLGELLPACRRYLEHTGRRLTFEYVLIDGVNDLPEHARELGRLLRGLTCQVNLIPMNPVAERQLHSSPPEAQARFRGLLRGAGIPCTIRRQLGASIDAACGQLRRHVEAGV